MINDKGLTLIKMFEGLKMHPYMCQAGKPTIGYGTTYYPNGKKVKLTDPKITEAVADYYLKYKLSELEIEVKEITPKSITENQMAALLSFVYNYSVTKLRRSTLLKIINRDANDPQIKLEFLKWNKYTDPVTKQKLISKGLTRRRKAESELYFLT